MIIGIKCNNGRGDDYYIYINPDDIVALHPKKNDAGEIVGTYIVTQSALRGYHNDLAYYRNVRSISMAPPSLYDWCSESIKTPGELQEIINRQIRDNK